MGPPTSGIPGFTAGRKGRAPSRETSHASICPGHELFVGHSWGEGGGTLHDSRLAGGARRPEGVAWTRLVLRALSAAPGTARRFAPLGAGVVFRRAVRRMSCNRKPIREGARPHHDAVLERRATSDRPARGAAAGALFYAARLGSTAPCSINSITGRSPPPAITLRPRRSSVR